MSELTEKNCEPCEGNDVEPMTMDEARDYLKNVNEWTLDSLPKIKKSYSFADFVTAIDFVNSIAEIAEDEGHHPNICIDYNTVKITIWTHAIDGLSENDFILAAKLDEVAVQYQ